MLKYYILTLLILLIEQVVWFSSYFFTPKGTYVKTIQMAQVVPHQLRRDVQSMAWDVQEGMREVWPSFGQDYQQIFI